MMKWLAVLVLVVAGAAAAQTPTPTLAVNPAQDCCQAWNLPGCDDIVCEACICQGVGATSGTPDVVCCQNVLQGGVYDFQCSQEALGAQGLINCAAQCACSRLITPTVPTAARPTSTPTETPLITGQCMVNTPISGQVIVDEDTPTPIPTDTPGGITHTPTQTPTQTATATSTVPPTIGCPCSDTIGGTIYRPDGTVDANDTVTFVSQITHPIVLGGCMVSPMPPVSTTTDKNGVMKPIKLPCGMPISVTLAHGGGAPVQSYVPFMASSDFADVLAITTLGRTFP